MEGQPFCTKDMWESYCDSREFGGEALKACGQGVEYEDVGLGQVASRAQLEAALPGMLVLAVADFDRQKLKFTSTADLAAMNLADEARKAYSVVPITQSAGEQPGSAINEEGSPQARVA